MSVMELRYLGEQVATGAALYFFLWGMCGWLIAYGWIKFYYLIPKDTRKWKKY